MGRRCLRCGGVDRIHGLRSVREAPDFSVAEINHDLPVHLRATVRIPQHLHAGLDVKRKRLGVGMWAKRMVPDERNFITAGLNSLLIRTGDRNVLVETGMGNKLSERMIKVHGQPAQLLDKMAAAGVAPEDIDIVINTHLHFDHCGWNTIRKGDQVVATFPKATYYAPEGEWEHGRLQLERDAVSYISANYDPLIASGQMKLLRGDQEIVPGISVQVFPGHTANMFNFRLAKDFFVEFLFAWMTLPAPAYLLAVIA